MNSNLPPRHHHHHCHPTRNSMVRQSPYLYVLVSDINVYTAFQLEEFFNGQNTLLMAEYVTYAPVELEIARNDHNWAQYIHQLGAVLWLFITEARVIDMCMVPNRFAPHWQTHAQH